MNQSDLEVALATANGLRHPDLIDVTKFVVVASFTFVLLEIISTLPDEIALVWPARTSPMKVLYLINKYSPLVDILVVSFLEFHASDTQSCLKLYRAVAYAILFGTLVFELILIGRTWALWQFNRRVIALTILGTAGALSLAIYAIEKALVSDQYIPQPVLHIVGCMPAIHYQGTWPAFACIIFEESCIAIATLIRMWSDSRRIDKASEGILHHTMYRDAIVFFLVILAVSVVNLIVMMVAPPELGPFFHLPLRTVHSALCTRVLINLRKAAACTSGTTLGEFTMNTTLAFRSVDAMPLPPSPETEEPGHYDSQPRQLGHWCSFQEIVFTSDSASEVGVGEWA